MYRALWKLTWTQIKLYLREPPAFFFTLAFPVMLVLLFGAAFGNKPYPYTEYGFVDYYVPALMALIAGTVGLMGIPIDVASARENGELKRFQATPLSARLYSLAHLATNLSMNWIAALLTVVVGLLSYNLALPRHPWAIVGAGVLGALGFAGLGYLLAAVMPTARSAQIAGAALFFPMMFLSGTSLPVEMFPQWLQRVAEVLPMTRMVHLMTELWLSTTPQGLAKDLLWLGVMAIVGMVAVDRLFRWR